MRRSRIILCVVFVIIGVSSLLAGLCLLVYPLPQDEDPSESVMSDPTSQL